MFRAQYMMDQSHYSFWKWQNVWRSLKHRRDQSRTKICWRWFILRLKTCYRITTWLLPRANLFHPLCHLVTRGCYIFHLYLVDGAQLYRRIHCENSMKAIQEDVTDSFLWLKNRLLEIHCEKCVKLTFGSRNAINKRPYNLQCRVLNSVATIKKYLRITIDKKF